MTNARRPARQGSAVLALAATLTLWLWPVIAFPLDVPPLTGRIVDLAHILPSETAATLTEELAAQEAKTGNQVAVLILPSLEGEPLESFSHRVATTWMLGRKRTDDGLLLLVALRERKVRIEVGYGLEGTLTDLRASRIIRNDIVPRFRSGDLPGGVVAGTRAILKTLEGGEPQDAAPPQPAEPSTPSGPSLYLVIGIVVGTLAGFILSHGLHRTRALLGSLLAFLIAQFGSLVLGIVAAGVTAFLLLWLLQGGRGGGRRAAWGPDMHWSGGGWGGGGGGFSGGGGDFGGGGASGDW